MPRLPLSTLAVVLAGVVACPGCSTSRTELCHPVAAVPPEGVVFVADGAGDYRSCSAALRQAARKDDLLLHVETFVWSHGHHRNLADQIDQGHVRAQGWRLADLVMAQRAVGPDVPVYLLAHSAGCAVVLAAAEALPPGSVERIVLLAPSAPADYDLRPALRCPRQGIDVFCSRGDCWCMGLAAVLGGVVQGDWCWGAGLDGFRPIVHTAEDEACYRKLRQHAWDPSLKCVGHDGGHYGACQERHLRAYVLPLLSLQPARCTHPY